MISEYKIPANRVVPIIKRLVLEAEENAPATRNQHTGGGSILARKAKLKRNTLNKILGGRSTYLTFSMVDQIFCAAGDPRVWHNELSDVYNSIVFLDPRECGHCSKEFIPTRTTSRFCTQSCRSRFYANRSTTRAA